MRFEVLGPLRVTGESGPVELSAIKQRALLAVMLSRAGAPVAVDRLADALWGDDPPAEYRKRVAWHVTKLRNALDSPDRIQWDSNGYSITLAAGEFDAIEFESMYDSATSVATLRDPEFVSRLLGKALGLWQGTAYAEFDDYETLSSEAVRLEELRLTALEQRVDADLQLRRHNRLVPELTTLVAEYPLREYFAAQLMLALYRCDRQAEALDVLRRARTHLVAELGIEPGARLRELESAILRNDPKLDLTASVLVEPSATTPAELPAAPVAFTGRHEEVENLRRCVGEATAPIVISAVTGIGGVGKSALAIHIGHQIAKNFPSGQLYVNLHGATPDAAPLAPAEALLRLLRSLDITDPPPDATLDELAGRFRSAVASKRILLVLDNARNAAQVRPLLPGGDGCAVIITSRHSLASLDGATHLSLDVLCDNDSVALFTQLVQRQVRTGDEDAIAVIIQRCGRMPLALCVAAAQLNANPRRTFAEFADRLAEESDTLAELDDGERAIRSTFMVSYQDLIETQPAAARLFRLLTLHNGTDIGLPVAASLAGLSEVEAATALDVLVNAHLVENHAPKRFRMHDLLRLFARGRTTVEDSEPQRDAAIQRMRHCYLATARNAFRSVRPDHDGSKRLTVPPHDLVHGGIDLEERDAAFEWASEEINNVVLTMVDDNAMWTCSMAAAISPVLHDMGYLRTLRQICDLVIDSGAASDIGEFAYYPYKDAAEVEIALRNTDAAMRLSQHALSIARASGDKTWEESTLAGMISVLVQLKDYDQALSYAQRSLEINRQTEDLVNESSTRISVGLLYDQLGRYDEAIDAFRAAEQCALHAGAGFNRAAAKGNCGQTLRAAGRVREAVECLDEALLVLHEADLSGSGLESDQLWGLGEAHYELGEHERAQDCWRRSASILHHLNLISSAEKEAIDTSPRPDTPELFKA